MAMDVTITVVRDDNDEPMRFRVSIKACVKEETTPYTTTSSTSTSTSAYPGTTSTTSTSTSAYPGTTTSTSTSAYPGTSPTTSTSTSAYPGTSPTTSTSTSVYPGTSPTTSSTTSSVYITPTTVCTVEEGMDDPQYIPDENIDDGGNSEPVSRLRPSTNKPYSVDRRTITIKFTFVRPMPLESVRLINPENVQSITITYDAPGRPNTEIPVVEVHTVYSLNFSICRFG